MAIQPAKRLQSKGEFTRFQRLAFALDEDRKKFYASSQATLQAMMDASVSLREAQERIGHLEGQVEKLTSRLVKRGRRR